MIQFLREINACDGSQDLRLYLGIGAQKEGSDDCWVYPVADFEAKGRGIKQEFASNKINLPQKGIREHSHFVGQ